MPETYPNDTALLDLERDDATGVEYIPTGASPYFIAYRRMLYRLLRSAERANDLRVFEMGGRTIGVRAGRCFVGNQPRAIDEAGPIELDASATTHVYVNSSGVVWTSTTGLPADRATFIPLAEVVTDADHVTQLTDLRGEALLQAQTAALAGITATSQEISAALDGVGPGVTAANLTTLTAGWDSTADAAHRHLTQGQDVDAPAVFTFSNLSANAAANVRLDFYLPNAMPDATALAVDRGNGFLQQSYLGKAYHLVGATALNWSHSGALSASATAQLVGAVPIGGEVVAVVLSCGLNTQSSDSGDGLSLDAFVNGSALTTAPATITSADGVGFQSTDQGAGSAPTLATSGAQNVNRGDLITLDLTYTANGTVSQPPTHVGVVVVVKAGRPA